MRLLKAVGIALVPYSRFLLPVDSVTVKKEISKHVTSKANKTIRHLRQNKKIRGSTSQNIPGRKDQELPERKPIGTAKCKDVSISSQQRGGAGGLAKSECREPASLTPPDGPSSEPSSQPSDRSSRQPSSQPSSLTPPPTTPSPVVPPTPRLKFVGQCSDNDSCGICEGDCDSDIDCDVGLSCFIRDSDTRTSAIPVPGCSGNPSGLFSKDFCYETALAPCQDVDEFIDDDGKQQDCSWVARERGVVFERCKFYGDYCRETCGYCRPRPPP